MVSPVQSTIGNTFNLDSTLDFDASISSTASFTFTPYNSANIRVVWGDGAVEVFNFSQQTTISHTYNNTAVNRIQFFNINSSLQRFAIDNQDREFKLNSQDLPKGANEYVIRKQDLSEDDFAKFPDAEFYSLRNSVFVGILADAPSGIDALNLSRAGGNTFPKVSGSLSNLNMKSGFSLLNLSGADLTESNTSDIPKGGEAYRFKKTLFNNGEINFINSLSNNLVFLIITNLNLGNGLQYTSTAYTVNVSNALIDVRAVNLTQTEVDNFLVDLDNSGSTDGTLSIGGRGFDTNAAPSSTGQNAVNSLVNKGWSITTS